MPTGASPPIAASSPSASPSNEPMGEALTEPERSLLFWGIHVLASARDTRIHQPLMRSAIEPGAASARSIAFSGR
jgi:hypothetical protein